jgi:hypothetical protein
LHGRAEFARALIHFGCDHAEYPRTASSTIASSDSAARVSRNCGHQKHVVPLSRQSSSILRKLHALTGDGKYL